MEMTSKKQTVKTFVLKTYTPLERKTLQDFIRNSIYLGQSARENLINMMRGFNDAEDIKEKIATESEMLEYLKKAGLKTTKQVLIKHRQQGHLDGMFNLNGQKRVVYRVLPVVKFFKRRQGKGSGGWLNRVKTKEANVAAA